LEVYRHETANLSNLSNKLKNLPPAHKTVSPLHKALALQKLQQLIKPKTNHVIFDMAN